MIRGRILPLAALAVAVLLLASGPVPSFAAADCTSTISSAVSIQVAIDAAPAGAVICLQPGTYAPAATINVNKPVTIRGPQVGVDPRPSFGSSRLLGSGAEAVVDGGGLSSIFLITADDVVLEGLEVTNGSGDLVTSPSSTTQSAPVVRHNIVHHSTGDEGIQLKTVTDAVIEYNHVYDTAGDGINIGYTSSGGTIRANEVHDISSPDGGIYVYGTPNVTIECNLVYDIWNNDGIKLGAKGGSDALRSGGRIAYNTVHNTAQDGIALYMSNTEIVGNEVSGSTSENGGIYLAWGISNVSISHNEVHDNSFATGKWGNPAGIMIGTAVDAGTVLVSYNNLYNNVPNGVTNKASDLLDAEGNWWGAADGPSGAGSGSGDVVSANVDFDPWLGGPVAISDPCSPDELGPDTTDVAASPNPVAVDASYTISALVDDTDTGGSLIAAAEASLDGWATSITLDAADGAFDEVAEDVSATASAPSEAGIYNLCVRGTDGADNTGAEICIMLVVYDPDGGFVTGGGWIQSPAGAMPAGTETVTISGVSGSTTVDPDATYAAYYLRHVGDPPPAGFDPAHNYQWATPAILTPSPEDGPMTLTGWIDVDDQVVGDVAMIGLLDYDDLAAGNSSFQRGAYMYIYRRSATSWRIGVSDGNTGGEIVQTYATVSDTDLPTDGVLDVEFTLDGTVDGATCAVGVHTSPAGCMTLTVVGGSVNATLTDSYGDILGTNGNPIEFAGGAVPGWDDYVGSNVAYSLDVPSYRPGSPEGRASFGFVSKYKKGAEIPTGNTEFVFEAGDLEFHSTSYDWLVVTGSNYAKFKGTGSVNGEGNYKFMIWAGDGEPDTFRIKIWWEDTDGEHVLYDNGSDQAIGGGSIVVHTGKK